MNLNGDVTLAIHELVQRVMPSLVVVHNRRSGGGAGIVWKEEGLILTNDHVVRRHALTVVLQDDGEYPAQLLARDPNVDLALLSIDADHLTPLKPADVGPRVGELVFAFGHPWGQRNTVTRGIISALTFAQNRRGERLPILRSDVPLAPGNSGGPLVNAHGELVGINAMIIGGDQSVSIAGSVVDDFVNRVLAKDNPGTRSNGHTPPDQI